MSEENFNHIVHSIQNGDSNAFGEIIRQYRHYCLKQFHGKYKVSKEIAEELTQDALLVLYQKIKSSNFQFRNENSISSFLYDVCYKKYLAYYQKQIKAKNKLDEYRTIKLSEADEQEEIDEILMDEAIWAAIETLEGRNCQKMIKLRYSEGQSLIEIAKKLAYSNNKTASEKMRRCKAELSEKAQRIYQKWKNEGRL